MMIVLHHTLLTYPEKQSTILPPLENSYKKGIFIKGHN